MSRLQEKDRLPDYIVIERDELPDSELEGLRHGGAQVCVIFVDFASGTGPRLHRHPYQEIFIVLEGHPRFTVASQIVDAREGQILIVQPGVAHKFVNSGMGRLRQIDIHVSPKFITEWLESA